MLSLSCAVQPTGETSEIKDAVTRFSVLQIPNTVGCDKCYKYFYFKLLFVRHEVAQTEQQMHCPCLTGRPEKQEAGINLMMLSCAHFRR